MKKLLIGVVAAALLLTGCTETEPDTRELQYDDAKKESDSRTPPDVSGDTEYNNYIKAQEEVYDDPATIIWCTVFPQATNAPIFTVPIQGKLTSSSVSYYPNQTLRSVDVGEANGDILVEAQSVDGMYHGSPPPYRYGFTPGGQYVDFTDLPTFCTTALTEFQEQTLVVDYADGVSKASTLEDSE